MITPLFIRERLLPAGVMAFMLVAFLALSLHFDGRWWAAHHGFEIAARPASRLAPVPESTSPQATTLTSFKKDVARIPATVARGSSEKVLRLPGPLHWDVIRSKTWNGIEATMPAPAPLAHPAIAEKNPKRPFRTLGVSETRQIMREIAEAEARSRQEALGADPAYGSRFASTLQRNLISYRQAIADAHELSAEQMSAIYRQMIEAPRPQHGAPPHLANILP